MKDAEARDIIPGKIYRDVGAIVLNFDPTRSNPYLMRQLE